MDFWEAMGLVGRVATLAQERDEYREEARRCRHLAKAMLESMDSAGVVFETEVIDGRIVMTLCAPNLDEDNLGPALAVAIKELFAQTGTTDAAWSVTLTGALARRDG